MSESFEELKVRLYPTTIRLPMWVRPLTLRTALSNLRISEARVRKLSEQFTIKGLFKSPLNPKFKVTLDPAEILEDVRAEVPVDGVEIVEWMQVAYVENVIMQARIAEYNAIGSQLAGSSGDGYIPGVVVEDISFEHIRGTGVSSRGFAIAYTPRGNFNVPNMRKSPGVFQDLISWGSISWVGTVQYVGNLLKWKSLAETPINQAVGFYRDSAGNVAPQFFVQQPTRPALTVTVKQVFSSDTDQTLNINFRDPTNYAKVLGSKKVDIAAGTCEVTYTVTAFPYVPPLIAEIQPQDKTNTNLQQYTVT